MATAPIRSSVSRLHTNSNEMLSGMGSAVQDLLAYGPIPPELLRPIRWDDNRLCQWCGDFCHVSHLDRCPRRMSPCGVCGEQCFVGQQAAYPTLRYLAAHEAECERLHMNVVLDHMARKQKQEDIYGPAATASNRRDAEVGASASRRYVDPVDLVVRRVSSSAHFDRNPMAQSRSQQQQSFADGGGSAPMPSRVMASGAASDVGSADHRGSAPSARASRLIAGGATLSVSAMSESAIIPAQRSPPHTLPPSLHGGSPTAQPSAERPYSARSASGDAASAGMNRSPSPPSDEPAHGGLTACPWCGKLAVAGHAKSCTFRKVRCKHCQAHVIRKDVKLHAAMCPAKTRPA
jgi:hypothetical protein